MLATGVWVTCVGLVMYGGKEDPPGEVMRIAGRITVRHRIAVYFIPAVIFAVGAGAAGSPWTTLLQFLAVATVSLLIGRSGAVVPATMVPQYSLARRETPTIALGALCWLIVFAVWATIALIGQY